MRLDKWLPNARDLLFLAGCGFIFYGLRGWSESLAFTVLGVLLIGVALGPYLIKGQ